MERNLKLKCWNIFLFYFPKKFNRNVNIFIDIQRMVITWPLFPYFSMRLCYDIGFILWNDFSFSFLIWWNKSDLLFFLCEQLKIKNNHRRKHCINRTETVHIPFIIYNMMRHVWPCQRATQPKICSWKKDSWCSFYAHIKRNIHSVIRSLWINYYQAIYIHSTHWSRWILFDVFIFLSCLNVLAQIWRKNILLFVHNQLNNVSYDIVDEF